MAEHTSGPAAGIAACGQGVLSEDGTVPVKCCTKCLELKPITAFPWRKDKAVPGRHSWCQACMTLYNRRRYLEQQEQRKDYSRQRYAGIRSDPQRFLAYSIRLAASRLGLDADLIAQHFESHHGCCDICGGRNVKGRTRLAIDHDHEAGEFRGLLCSTCNTAIGLLRDSPKVARAAAAYLRSRGL